MARAELFDGTVLEFEDGTPDDVISTVAKRETDRIRSATPLPRGVAPSTTGAGRSSGLGGAQATDQSPPIAQADQIGTQASEARGFDPNAAERTRGLADLRHAGVRTESLPSEVPVRRVNPYGEGGSVLDKPTGGGDIVAPQYIAQQREAFRDFPIEERLPALRKLAARDTIQGRAAKALLAQVELENTQKPTSVQDERLAQQVMKAPRGPVQTGSGAPDQPVRFPDSTPNYGDVMDATPPAEVAARRGIAAGLGEAATQQKVGEWGDAARRQKELQTPEGQARLKERSKAAADVAARNMTTATGSQFIGDVVGKAVDIGLDVAAIAPGTAKLAVDIASMARIPGTDSLSEKLDNIAKTMSGAQSALFEAKSQMMQDVAQNGTPDQLALFLVTNPGFTTQFIASSGIQSSGSMALGAGGAVAGKLLAEARAVRQGLGAARVAQAGSTGATVGATAANMAMNAGSNFAETKGDLADKYISAAIAAAGTAVVGKFTEGGAEGALARGNSGGRAKTALKEGAQEFGENFSQSLGKQGAETGQFDPAQATNEGILGALPGAAMGAAVGKKRSAYDAAAAAGFHVEPPLTTDPAKTQRAKTLDIFENVAAKYGMNEAAKARALEAVKDLPLDDVGPFLTRLTNAYASRGLVKAPDQHAVDTLNAGPVAPPEDSGKDAGNAAPPTAADRRETPPTDEATALERRLAQQFGIQDDGTGLSEAPVPQEDAPPKPDDLLTVDGEPYGTKAAAQARATREEGDFEIAKVQGGFVPRPVETAATPAPSPAAGIAAPPTKEDDEERTQGVPQARKDGVPEERARRGQEGQGAIPAAQGDVQKAAVLTHGRLIGKVGRTPAAAVAVHLHQNKDGTLTPVHPGGEEMLNFETGQPIVLPAGISDLGAIGAIRTAGAISNKSRFFNVKGEDNAAAQVTKQASSQPEYQDRNVPRQAPEASGGDSAERAAEVTTTSATEIEQPSEKTLKVELLKRIGFLKALRECIFK